MKQTASKFSGAIMALSCMLVLATNSAHALDYVSVSDSTAILYDANSTKAKKLFVVSRYTPLEKVVNLENWIKVRDSSGSLAWIERRAVSDKQYVAVTVALATVWKAPESNAPVLYQVPRSTAMESLGINGGGWIKVRDQEGAVGYMKSVEVWGTE